ncbi:hypothetical protein DL765_008294 [Monosporascus sp. GIB2]|nr:hypothetical protein DL765_008294 [Monosporascus sp. GIB2]
MEVTNVVHICSSILSTVTSAGTIILHVTGGFGVRLDNRLADWDDDGGTGVLDYRERLQDCGYRVLQQFVDPSSSPIATIQNKCIWALDSDGNLILSNPTLPYTYKYDACVSATSSGRAWAQVGIHETVQTAINNGGKWAIVRGCIGSATGKLSLDAGGRKKCTVVRRPVLDIPGQWQEYQSWWLLPDTAQDWGYLGNSADGLPSNGDADDA